MLATLILTGLSLAGALHRHAVNHGQAHSLRQAPPDSDVVPSKKTNRKDASWTDICGKKYKLGIEEDKVVYSNLGGHGPHTQWEDGILLGSLFPDFSVDMGLTVEGTYYPFNISRNKVSGDMLVISVNPGTSVRLKMVFFNRSRIPTTVDNLMLTFGGLDTLAAGDGGKALNISGFTKFATRGSTVDVTEQGDFAVFRSGANGTLPSDDMHALDLSNKEMERAVVFHFENVTEIDFTLSSDSGDDEPREFYIGGQSNLVCPTRARCSSFTCPDYYQLKTSAKDIYCKGKECREHADLTKCCFTSIPELCTPHSTLMFPPDSVQYSNLGGKGPDTTKPEGIRYKNVFPAKKERVDMIVTASKDYEPSNETINGQFVEYGIINLQSASSVDLHFQFVDPMKLDRPVKIGEGFYFTVYDFDNQKDGLGVEIVHANGFEWWEVSNTSTIKISRDNANRTVFSSTVYGTVEDNPKSPQELTQADVDKTVQFFYKGDHFDLTLEVDGGLEGRNFLFTGYSLLRCPNASMCTNYTCPAGWTKQKHPEQRMCEATPCSDEDLHTCCVPEKQRRARCSSMVCPHWSISRPDASSVFCESSACTHKDVSTCCLVENCNTSSQISLERVTHSNFAGDGPDNGRKALIYENVVPHSGKSIDLQVVAVRGASQRPKANGLFGHYGVVNLQSDALLRFTFVEGGTSEVVNSMKQYFFTLGAFKRGETRSFDVTFVPEISSVLMAADSALSFDRGTVEMSEFLPLAGLPLDPLAMTTAMQTYALSAAIERPEFYLNVSSAGPAEIFFSGASSLGCPLRQSCLTYSCPDGYVPKPNAADEYCSGETCTADDLFTCCNCDGAPELSFRDRNVVVNTISDHPANGSRDLLITDVFRNVNSTNGVGLRISPEGTFYYHNASANGVIGNFLRLNVLQGTGATFLFQFIDQDTNQLFSPPAFFLTLLDLDQQADGGCQESVYVSEVAYHTLSNETSVLRTDDGWFHSSQAGNYEDNPSHPMALTSDHLSRSLSLMIPAGTSEFRLRVNISGGWMSGRNIVLSGASNLVCPERALCDSAVCPAGSKLDHRAARRVCAGAACTQQDINMCCESV